MDIQRTALTLVLFVSAASAAGAPSPCAKLPKTAVEATQRARSESDWVQWDPKLTTALKSLWQRSVLALSGATASHTTPNGAGGKRRPAAVGPFEAASWTLGDSTVVAFRVPVVSASESENPATRTERFVGYWADGKLARIDDACLQTMEPSYIDVAARVAYGKPLSGECTTVSCPLPKR